MIGTTNGLASWKDGKLTTYSELNGSRILALLEDRNGTVWAATREARIFGENVGPIDADAEGNFWVGFDKDSRKWKSGRPQSFEVPDSMHSQPALAELEQFAFPTANHKQLTKSVAAQFERGASTVLSQHLKPPQILRDRDGALWVAIPDRGLVHIHHGKTDVFSEADGLSGDTVTGLLEDREGNVWAVINGIDRFREYAVPNISIKQGLSSTNSVAIVAAKDGSVWVATYNGLNRWKDGRISVVNRIGSTQDPNRTPKGAPYSLFEDSERRIWLSTVQEFGYLENNRFVPVRDVHGGRITSMAEGPPDICGWRKRRMASFIYSRGEWSRNFRGLHWDTTTTAALSWPILRSTEYGWDSAQEVFPTSQMERFGSRTRSPKGLARAG